jgi:hypothetical protein
MARASYRQLRLTVSGQESFLKCCLVAKRKRRAKELAAGGSGDAEQGVSPVQSCGSGRAATTESVYPKVIVPELRRGDEVMDQLFG